MKNLLTRRWVQILIPILLLSAVLVLPLLFPDDFESQQLKFFDLFQRLRPRPYQEAPVLIVDIDEETLAQYGQWPWPRTRVAELITRLTEAGASVIALDIIFAEPDRTSPKNILTLWPQTPELVSLHNVIEKLPDHDEILVQAFEKAPVVTSFGLIPEINDHHPLSKASFAFTGDAPKSSLPAFQGAVVNLPAIEAAGSGNGSVSLVPERDGVIRRVPLLGRLGDEIYPSFVLEALRVAQKAKTYIIKSVGSQGEKGFGNHTGIVSIKAGQFVIPTDPEGKIFLYDSGGRKERYLSAWKIFSKNFSPDQVEGKIVFVGTSALGLKDLRTTPLVPFIPGVEIQASLVEQILLQDFLHRPDWAPGAEWLYVLFLGLALIFLMPWIGAFWGAVIAGGFALGALSFSWYLFTTSGRLLDALWPCFAILCIYLSSSLLQFLRTESERRQIRNAFSHYMSPIMVERLAKHPEKLKLGGETKDLSLLFSDIRGFTTLSEKFSAEELVSFLNRFLTPMTEIILHHAGTIDKYIGDCIMAFWNAPLDHPDHAVQACKAALKMKHHLVEWNQNFRAEALAAKKSFDPIHIGIGINTGDCCVGNIGSNQRFDYSVLGDEVNLASRLEGQTKVFGVDIVIGEKTFVPLKEHFASLEIDLVRVKGKTKPSKIFGLLGDQTLRSEGSFQKLAEAHGKMLAAYRSQNWSESLQWINQCLNLDTPETRLRQLYRVYMERIQAFQSNPPPKDWQGAVDAATK